MTNPASQSQLDEYALVQAGYRYAYSLTHNRHDAEDLVQQACLRVFQLKGKLGEKKYLFVVIRNLYIDRWRAQQRGSTQNMGSDFDQPDGAANHVDVVDNRIDVESMLAGLRFEERELLYLNCVEGYSAAEIGEITGTSRNTILSQLARAKKKLRKQAQETQEMQNAD